MSEGSQLVCHRRERWYLVGIGLGVCSHDDLGGLFESYFLTNTAPFIEWFGQVFSEWNNMTSDLPVWSAR